LSRDAIRQSATPQIKGLFMDHLFAFAKGREQSLKYLPDPSEWPGIDRLWFCNVLHSTDAVHFKKFVDEAKSTLAAKRVFKDNSVVTVRPEFAEALQNCIGLSSKWLIREWSPDIFELVPPLLARRT